MGPTSSFARTRKCWSINTIISCILFGTHMVLMIPMRNAIDITTVNSTLNDTISSLNSSVSQLPPLPLVLSSLSLPGARIGMTMTSVGHLLICASGITVDIFNMRTWTWSSSVIPNANPLVQPISVGLGDRYGIIMALSYSHILDINDMTWTTSQSSSYRQSIVATTTENGCGVFVGGHEAAQASKVVRIWCATTKVWNTTMMDIARMGHAAIGYGTKVYIAGGRSATGNQNYTSIIEILDVITMKWQQQRTLIGPARMGLAAAIIGNFVIFAGGHITVGISGSVAYNKTDILDMNTSIVTAGPSLTEDRYALSGASIAGRAMFIGGYNNKVGWSERIEIFDPDDLHRYTSTIKLQTAILQPVTVVVDGIIIIVDSVVGTTKRLDLYGIGELGQYTIIGTAPSYNYNCTMSALNICINSWITFMSDM
jgi:hypothetical protein